MNIAAWLIIAAMSWSAPVQARQAGYPEAWAKLLKKISPADANSMLERANRWCETLDYTSQDRLFRSLDDCSLMEASAIMDIDVSMADLEWRPAWPFRDGMIDDCWKLYRAHGEADVIILEKCYGDLEGKEYLQAYVKRTRE